MAETSDASKLTNGPLTNLNQSATILTERSVMSLKKFVGAGDVPTQVKTPDLFTQRQRRIIEAAITDD